MKSVLAAILCLAVLTAQAQVKTNAPPKGGGIGLGILALGVAVVGCYAVVYAYNKSANRDSAVGPAVLVMERSEWGGAWSPVATNYIPRCTTNKWVLFDDRMHGQGCRYRIKEYPL